MKISIEEISKELIEEILIRCHEVDEEILEIVNKLKTEPPSYLDIKMMAFTELMLETSIISKQLMERFLVTARIIFLR
ncbi:hypothetical protein ACQKNX_09835 [Lysinibacillus sp. NPDC093712]|uniref:hypothetical protein n=1 Tax=Lysinibacillus sp. NPDC093712 TaxID=3390579 RepID=UPI003CFEB7FE